MGLNFLSPEWLYWSPLLLGGLVILYFLKLKRREVAVASTYLWKKALQDLRVNSPFQRLRMNILLILQLLLLSALILGLARPVSTFSGLRGRDHVILIDRSASMSATDGGSGKTRLAKGLEEARRLVGSFGLGDRGVVIAFDDQAELLTSLTEQKSVLEEALAKVQPTDRRTKLRDAIEVANGVLPNLREPVLTILSDGRVGSTKDLSVPGSVEVHYVKLGEASPNLAITNLEVRRAFEGGEASRVFATVSNSGEETRTVGVDCFLEDELVTSKDVEVPKHGTASVAFESAKLRSGRLRVAIDATDVLPTDDVAYAVLREKKDVRVLLVTPGNPFLERALQEDPLVRKDPSGNVPRIEPGQLIPDDPNLKLFDLVVIDRAELKGLPAGNYLLVDTVPPFEGIRFKGMAPWPSVVDWEETHPIARFVTFGSLDPTAARRMELRKEDKVVVSSTWGNDGGARRKRPKKKDAADAADAAAGEAPGTLPLIFEARDGDRRALVLAFDLMKTQSWPLKAAFPIFLANAVRWLGGAGREERTLSVLTGEVAEVLVPKGAKSARVLDPSGKERVVELKPGDDVLRFAETSRAGFYEVKFEGEMDAQEPGAKVWFVANLASIDESDIAPAERIELESQAVKGEAKIQEPRREAWKLAAIVAFLLLMAEWWVYNRRMFV